MPKTVHVTINVEDHYPEPVPLDRGDKVNWYNNTGETVTLKLPPIFSPQGDPTIDDGETSRDFTVNNNATVGSYTYKITALERAPRNGTIDVT